MHTMSFQVSMMSFNIRLDVSDTKSIFAAPPETIESFAGELPWSVRKFKVADTILFYQPDIVGLQEPLYNQLVDLHTLLGNEYDWEGVGRLDGKLKGEFTAIFYKKALFEPIHTKIIWLSETPDQVASIGWNAKHPRTANFTTFRSLNADDKVFTVINTHLDHTSGESRLGAAKLILERAKTIHEEKSSDCEPIFLMGDFNAVELDPAYQWLTGAAGQPPSNRTWDHLTALNDKAALLHASTTGRPVRTTENSITLPTHRVFRRAPAAEDATGAKTNNSVFVDTRYALVTPLTHPGGAGCLSGPYGHHTSFTSFGEEAEKQKAFSLIDYIMYFSPSTPVVVKSYGILANQYDDGCLISDHRPVFVRLAW
ncbi:Endonuclease/exonuclease/phosphatase [Gongronella butleri]|nr:Endonuclease/exonuclease/phosphatase [Gongronella butleri]